MGEQGNQDETVNPFDVDKVVNGFEATYPSHANMPENEKLANDIGTSLNRITLTAYESIHRGAPEEALDSLFERSFKKISSFYEKPEDREVLRVMVEKGWEGQKNDEEAGRKTPEQGQSRFFEKYKGIFEASHEDK